MSTSMKITEQLLKPAIAGGLAGIISYARWCWTNSSNGKISSRMVINMNCCGNG